MYQVGGEASVAGILCSGGVMGLYFIGNFIIHLELIIHFYLFGIHLLTTHHVENSGLILGPEKCIRYDSSLQS